MFIEFTDSFGHRVAINKDKVIRLYEGGEYTYVLSENDNPSSGVNVRGTFEEVLEIFNSR